MNVFKGRLGFLVMTGLFGLGLARPAHAAMLDNSFMTGYTTALHITGTIIEFFGIGIMVLGAIVSSGVFVSQVIGATSFDEAFINFRTSLGRAILLGLEFLVIADIVGTVAVQPTFQNLGVLAVIIAIRTFLSFALEVEINGYWPWNERHYTRRD